ncbi:MAG: hypothetical protein AVDCRST_MAG56-4540, partial [uncultured Cytophagales bacterium]
GRTHPQPHRGTHRQPPGCPQRRHRRPQPGAAAQNERAGKSKRPGRIQQRRLPEAGRLLRERRVRQNHPFPRHHGERRPGRPRNNLGI